MFYIKELNNIFKITLTSLVAVSMIFSAQYGAQKQGKKTQSDGSKDNHFTYKMVAKELVKEPTLSPKEKEVVKKFISSNAVGIKDLTLFVSFLLYTRIIFLISLIFLALSTLISINDLPAIF